jgi:hypothetical protein
LTDTHTPTVAEGRQIRSAEVDISELDKFASTVEDVYDNKLDALMIRNAFPAEIAATVTERIRNDPDLPWLRPNRAGPNADLSVLGVPATPTFENPGGPPVDLYFDSAARYRKVTQDLFAPECDPGSYFTDLLSRVSGGRPATVAADANGRGFAPCTVRSLPEGQRIILHNDFYHYRLPVYQDVVSSLDARINLSFFVTLQAPKGGGEFVAHGLSHEDPEPMLPNGLPDAEVIKERYTSKVLPLGTGDVIIFAAGKLYHHVTPVVGPRPRITMGGFFAFDRGHEKVVYWS